MPTETAPRPSVDSMLSGLDFLWLELTGKCNLRCIHCYADSGPDRAIFGTLRPERWFDVLAEAAELGCRKVQFIGGEATLHPRLHALIDKARGDGFEHIELYTNATAVTPRLASTLKRARASVAFSIYGSTPEIHDRVTQRPGSFQRTMQGVVRLLEGGIPIRASIVIMEANADNLAQTHALLRQIGVSSIGSDRMRGVGRASTVGVSPSAQDELCGHCWAGKLAIDPDGRIFPCVFARTEPIGSAEVDLRMALDSPALRRFRRLQYEWTRTQDVAALTACKPPCLPIVCNPLVCSPTGECGPAHADNLPHA